MINVYTNIFKKYLESKQGGYKALYATQFVGNIETKAGGHHNNKHTGEHCNVV